MSADRLAVSEPKFDVLRSAENIEVLHAAPHKNLSLALINDAYVVKADYDWRIERKCHAGCYGNLTAFLCRHTQVSRRSRRENLRSYEMYDAQCGSLASIFDLNFADETISPIRRTNSRPLDADISPQFPTRGIVSSSNQVSCGIGTLLRRFGALSQRADLFANLLELDRPIEPGGDRFLSGMLKLALAGEIQAQRSNSQTDGSNGKDASEGRQPPRIPSGRSLDALRFFYGLFIGAILFVGGSFILYRRRKTLDAI